MSEVISAESTWLDQTVDTLFHAGRVLFSLAIVALGVETLVCARYFTHALGPQYTVIPVLPWLPAIPWLAYLFGAILVACGLGLLSQRTVRAAATTLGGLLLLCTIVLEVPKNVANIGSMSLRTGVFEPLALASLAWLFPGRVSTPDFLARAGHYLIALSFIVFGVDHFLALVGIGELLPGWIPWHVFWVAFFGAVIAGGLSLGFNWLQRWGAAGVGLMFAIWVVTLHLPRVLGLYGIPGAPHDPDEWSSLFIAVALCGGSWALVRIPPP